MQNTKADTALHITIKVHHPAEELIIAPDL
jgi:hypothetical protein